MLKLFVKILFVLIFPSCENMTIKLTKFRLMLKD